MQTIIATINWVTFIIACASIIAAVTKTPQDDIWIGKFYRLIDLLAINVGRSKDYPGDS